MVCDLGILLTWKFRLGGGQNPFGFDDITGGPLVVLDRNFYDARTAARPVSETLVSSIFLGNKWRNRKGTMIASG